MLHLRRVKSEFVSGTGEKHRRHQNAGNQQKHILSVYHAWTPEGVPGSGGTPEPTARLTCHWRSKLPSIGRKTARLHTENGALRRRIVAAILRFAATHLGIDQLRGRIFLGIEPARR